MANMSYCRFRNTIQDLADCYDRMDEEELSLEEHRARIRLIELCITIASEYGDEVTEEERGYPARARSGERIREGEHHEQTRTFHPVEVR